MGTPISAATRRTRATDRGHGFVAAVGEIDAHDVEPGGDHGAQNVVPVAGGSERGDDFCPFVSLGRRHR